MKEGFRWRDGMEMRGLRVNISKMVMINNIGSVLVSRNTIWTYTVCKSSAGSNSIPFIVCGDWAHRKWVV